MLLSLVAALTAAFCYGIGAVMQLLNNGFIVTDFASQAGDFLSRANVGNRCAVRLAAPLEKATASVKTKYR